MVPFIAEDPSAAHKFGILKLLHPLLGRYLPDSRVKVIELLFDRLANEMGWQLFICILISVELFEGSLVPVDVYVASANLIDSGNSFIPSVNNR